MIFHPLKTNCPLPSEMNNPFDYEPHPLCIQAAEEVKAAINTHQEWAEEVGKGKMFGVLLVEKTAKTDNGEGSTIGYLAAYSGQIMGRSDWDGFVPAVFDYLQPDGYFKLEEHCIDALNAEITLKEHELDNSPIRHQLQKLRNEAEKEIERKRLEMNAARQLRQLRRKEAHLSEREQQQMIRESQFLKAELHRTKKRFSDEISVFETKWKFLEQQVEDMRRLRRERSDRLQRWLFDQFRMVNAAGEQRTLTDIFRETALRIPPAGAGECCEPKLLQYAFLHGMKPLNIAMFWWGESPRQEIRHHGMYYPACSGKCKPILEWQLQKGHFTWGKGTVKVEQPPLHIIYEDDDLIAVNKQPGLLSIPGSDAPVSVYSWFRQHYPDLQTPAIVHRLDMDTSGILLLAKNKTCHRKLQQQFACHQVKKRYTALLERPIPKEIPLQGTIALPLRPDVSDRPRQIVDKEHGKPSETYYKVVGETNGHPRLHLYPHTGRTHQLRVHCAHVSGLSTPILGDRLYGCNANSSSATNTRLYLHADSITFVHPVSGEQMTLECTPDF